MKKVRKKHFGSTIKGKVTIYAAISMVVMIAITAYANMIHTPITIHSMSTASSSGINDVSSECTHWVTILKSNII